MVHDKVSYVDLDCVCCVVRVSAYGPRTDPAWEGWVDVEIMSNVTSAHYGRLSTRIKNAWRVLRGRYDWTGFQLDTKESALAFQDSYAKAVLEAFPSVASEVTTRKDRS